MSDTPRRVRAKPVPQTILLTAIGQTVHIAAHAFFKGQAGPSSAEATLLAVNLFGDELVRIATLCFNNPGKTHTCSFGALSFNKTTQQMELK